MLNAEQQKAADFREGQCALIAGPGSGKTTCITGRYSALVSEGVWPHEIISLTFTREAAESMMKRASATKDQFCTFHSLGLRIYTTERGSPNVDPEARHRLLAYLSKKWHREYKEIAAFISNCRRNGISVYDAPDENYALAKAYQEYEQRRQDEGWIDFDSMLAECISILQNPQARDRWQFKWVMADEMQDTEPCQLEILRLISQKHNNVFCVGDLNQSIYAFRNALTYFEDEMKKIWPETRVLYLSNNYRSHATLVDFIKRKAAHQNPVIQNMTAMRREKGQEIEYRQFATEYDEAEDAIANILKGKLSDSVVLTRTNRALLPFTVLCSKHDIPFRLLGRSGFWKQHEVQKTLKKLTEAIGWPVSTAINLVFPKIEMAYQVEDATVEDNRALENVKAVKDMLRGFTSVADFLAYANKATHAESSKKKSGVTLSTVHQAKGTEFKNVYLADCSIGRMPHDKGEPFEERRIFFVACSRAKDFLRISFTGYPSSFIRPDLTDEMLHKIELERNTVERIKCKSELR